MAEDTIKTDADSAQKLIREVKKTLLKAKQQGIFKSDSKEFYEIEKSINLVIESFRSLEKSGSLTSSEIANHISVVERISKKLGDSVSDHFKKIDDNLNGYRQSLKLWGDQAAQQSLKAKLLIAGTGKIADTITKYSETLTVAYQAQKLFRKVQEGAKLQQDLLIKSNMGLNTSFRGTSDASKFAGVGVAEFSKEVVDTTTSATILAESLAKAKASAVLFGASTEEAASQFARFSEITGEIGNTARSAEALERLTSASFAVSKALGISAAEATDYVATRLEKFGGTADSGVVSLKILYDRSEKINQTFGKTVVRSRDVARAIEDMSRETTTFAFDQRFAASVMQQNMMRLTAMGASYEEAKNKAQAYLDATMGDKAPEWMQILAGEGILTDLLSASKKGFPEFSKQFGKELDKSKPGLSRKVFNILEDGTLNMYEKSRLVQELTRGTTVGAMAMNKQILNLYEASGESLSVLAKQMNISREQAYEMVHMAKSAITNEKLAVELTKKGAKELAAALGLDLKTAQEIADTKDQSDKKSKIETALQNKEQKKLATTMATNRIKSNRDNLTQYQNLSKDIADADKKISESKSESDKMYYQSLRQKAVDSMSQLKFEPEFPKEKLDEFAADIQKQMQDADTQIKLLMEGPQTAQTKKQIQDLEMLKGELGTQLKEIKEAPKDTQKIVNAMKDVGEKTKTATDDLSSRMAASNTVQGKVIASALELLSGPLGTLATLVAAFAALKFGGPKIIAAGIRLAAQTTAIDSVIASRKTPPDGGGPPTGGLGGLGAGIRTRAGRFGDLIRRNKGKSALIALGLAGAAYGGYKMFGGGEATPEGITPEEAAEMGPKEEMGLGTKVGLGAAGLLGAGALAYGGKKLMKGGLKAGLKSLPGVGNLLTIADIAGGAVSDLAAGSGVLKTLGKAGLRSGAALMPVGAGVADLAISEGFDALFANKGRSVATVAGMAGTAATMASMMSSPAAAASAPYMGGGGGLGLTGSFGQVMPDGSVQITIQNFLSAFGQAQQFAAGVRSTPKG